MTDNLNQKGLEAAELAFRRGDSIRMATRIANAISAYLAEAGPAVQIKPLEWSNNMAVTIVGVYRLETFADGVVWGLDGIRHNHLSPLKSEADAMAAAQADYESNIRSALVSLPVEREGWKLVPKRVTDQMYVAFREELDEKGHIYRFVEAYRAMLDAAPTPPQQGER